MTTATATTRSRAKKPAAPAFSAPIAEVHLVPLDIIDVEEQIRKEFNQESIEELARDIAERGLMQPILLNPTTSGRFTLISGERRLRAVKHNGQEGIPALLTKASTDDALLMQLAENIQREELSFDDEVKAIAKLYEILGSLKEVAAKVKKSVPWCSKRYAMTKRELHYLARNLLEEGHTEDLELLKAFSDLVQLLPWYDGQEWANKIAKGEAGRKEIRAELKARKDAQKKRKAKQEKEEQEEQVSHAKQLPKEPPPPPPWELEEAIEELDDCLARWSEEKSLDVYFSYTEEQRQEVDQYFKECHEHGQHKDAFVRLSGFKAQRAYIRTIEFCAIMAGMKGDAWDTVGFLTLMDSMKPTD